MLHGKVFATYIVEVLGIALEVPEVLEARTHGAGLRVRPRVEPAIYLGHRALPVGREVVPEVLEIDALPAFHQRQRHLDRARATRASNRRCRAGRRPSG